MDNKIHEAIFYFESDPELLHVIKEIAKKYYYYGEFKGSINKSDLKNVEALLLFLGISQSKWRKTERFQVTEFISAYNDSKFGEINIKTVIEFIIGKKLLTKRDIDAGIEIRWQQYLSKVSEIAPTVYKLLAVSIIKRNFNKELSIDSFQKVELALKNLPTKLTRLPVFAYQLFENPHSLDKGRLLGNLFYDCIVSMGVKNRDNIDVYLAVNIVKDDILNFVTVKNLKGDSPIFKAAADNHLIWNVPLMQLMKMKIIEPIIGNKVFLIENSSVYAVIADKFKMVPLIMTSGQFKYATWKLLDLLPNNIEIYYSSDLDPAGLVMSQKILEKYPKRVHLFGMSDQLFVCEYTTSLKKLSIKTDVLNGIKNERLLSLKLLMKEKQCVVFQEAIISELIKSIEKHLKC
ncbi:TIGR02679 domain-containing protein [Companilactobacillus nantensis]|uniref:Wadjet protein JetD C-terminal domain-containing protein n=1 Tax=Companilactobacillus nantensis DSM 16982 TaxID=1423774 RepID=A0A0R1WBK6_9LACO|nr:TIGR02679 domain-containing protein [Companilactobacillus nantensis]KRM15223.1 hypothetical protein FD31_GL001346 [Companilactobacillus nantensis DSM 16982]GEO65277.1 hypothetical protein LNA01_24600 [Companilactobacillus nantensis]